MHLEYTNIPGIYKKECIGLFERNIRHIAFAVDIGVFANVKGKCNIPYIAFKEAYAFLFVYSWNIRIFQMHSSFRQCQGQRQYSVSGVCGSNEDCTGLFWEKIGWMCLDS